MVETYDKLGAYMEHPKPLDAIITQPYLEAMMTILEESIERKRLAETMRSAHGTLPDFHQAFFETITDLNQLLNELGGMPITYVDKRTNRVTHTTVFAYHHYDAPSDKWTVVATDHGQPPTSSMPIREVVLTTPELRSSYEEAQNTTLPPSYP